MEYADWVWIPAFRAIQYFSLSVFLICMLCSQLLFSFVVLFTNERLTHVQRRARKSKEILFTQLLECSLYFVRNFSLCLLPIILSFCSFPNWLSSPFPPYFPLLSQYIHIPSLHFNSLWSFLPSTSAHTPLLSTLKPLEMGSRYSCLSQCWWCISPGEERRSIFAGELVGLIRYQIISHTAGQISEYEIFHTFISCGFGTPHSSQFSLQAKCQWNVWFLHCKYTKNANLCSILKSQVFGFFCLGPFLLKNYVYIGEIFLSHKMTPFTSS